MVLASLTSLGTLVILNRAHRDSLPSDPKVIELTPHTANTVTRTYRISTPEDASDKICSTCNTFTTTLDVEKMSSTQASEPHGAYAPLRRFFLQPQKPQMSQSQGLVAPFSVKAICRWMQSRSWRAVGRAVVFAGQNQAGTAVGAAAVSKKLPLKMKENRYDFEMWTCFLPM